MDQLEALVAARWKLERVGHLSFEPPMEDSDSEWIRVRTRVGEVWVTETAMDALHGGFLPDLIYELEVAGGAERTLSQKLIGGFLLVLFLPQRIALQISPFLTGLIALGAAVFSVLALIALEWTIFGISTYVWIGVLFWRKSVSFYGV